MGKVKQFFEKQKDSYIGVIKQYKVTVICVALLSLINAITMDNDIIGDNELSKINYLISSLAIGALLIETIIDRVSFEKRVQTLTSSYVINVIMTLVTFFIVFEGEEFFSDLQYHICGKFILCYFAVIISVAFYNIIKNCNVEMHTYVARVVFGILKIVGLYFVVYLAMIAILGIFDSLIWDIEYWDTLSKFSLILAGFVYFPMVLNQFIAPYETNSKFTKGLILYALMPCVIVATAIIYMYIIKILAISEIPSNEVFSICSELFVLGAPVWVMAYGFIKEKKGEYNLNILEKIVKYMKYIYAPIISLEIIVISMRISQYGLTDDRYFAVVFIIIQLIYILWELIIKFVRGIKKSGEKVVFGDKYERLIFVLLGIFIFTTIMPGLNCDKLCFESQKNRFEEAVREKGLIAADGPYDYLKYSVYGETYLKENYTEQELEVFNVQTYDRDEDRIYVSYSHSMSQMDNGIDIAGYTKIYYFEYNDYETSFDDGITIEYADGKEISNVSVKEMIEFFVDKKEFGENWDSNETYMLYQDGNLKILVSGVNFTYYEYEEVTDSFRIYGYILER